MRTTVKLYALDYRQSRTYLTASIFVAGNIVLPQLFHLLPQGGITWLPIYFFTLVAAYKYGWQVGLITALCSPLVNSFLFGMPHPAALPAITLKSVLLATAAGYAAHHFQRISLLILAAVVLAYQSVGTLGEWLIIGNFSQAIQDFRIGLPGMCLQIFGGYYFLRQLLSK